MTLRVGFHGFWRHFQPEDFFVGFLESSLQSKIKVVSSKKELDILVSSVFTTGQSDPVTQNEGKAQPFRIWYSGEYVSPPLSGPDLTLSFFPESRNNLYLPLAFLSIDWNLKAKKFMRPAREFRRAGVAPRPVELSTSRAERFDFRKRFACAVVGNPEPKRMEALKELSRIGKVDVYGPAGNLGPVRNKFQVARGYRFMVCFENQPAPGYITEKIIDAWSSGCIPIWWGNDRDEILNPQSFVNLADFGNIDSMLEAVELLNTSADRFERTWREPLTRGQWSLENLQSRTKEMFYTHQEAKRS